LVDNADRKFDSVAELLVSPSALTMFWKLVCSAESVVLVVSDVSDEVVEPVLLLDDVNSEIRLCRLAANPDGPPLMPDVLLELVLDAVLDVESVLLCACSAAIRLCRKLPIACVALSVLVEELDVELEVALVLLVELESDWPPMPICANASEIAPSNPPPPPAPPGGGGQLSTLPELLVLLPD
jgi:hypothetical protein